ncbi:hypothetical protein ACI8AC_05825 [Geodermatophilus sp. SYSU D00758]
MSEVPGTDRDKAREDVLAETPYRPEGVEGVEDDHRGDEGRTGDEVKPEPGSTDLGTDT